jgi:hypothetical protein
MTIENRKVANGVSFTGLIPKVASTADVVAELTAVSTGANARLMVLLNQKGHEMNCGFCSYFNKRTNKSSP